MPRGSISSSVAPQPSRRDLRPAAGDAPWRTGIYTLRPSRDLPVIEATATVRTAVFPPSIAPALGLFASRQHWVLSMASVVGGGLGMATPFLPAALSCVLAPIAATLSLPPLCLAFLPLRVGMVSLVTRTFEFWYHTTTNVVVGVLAALYAHDTRALVVVSMVPWFLLGVLRDAHVRAQRHDSLLAALMALLAFANAFYVGAGAVEDHRSYTLLRYQGRSITIEALLAHGLVMLGILQAHLAYARRPRRIVRPDGAVQTSVACSFLQTPLQWQVADRLARGATHARSVRSEFSPSRIRLRCTSFRHIIDSDNVLCRRVSAWLLALPTATATLPPPSAPRSVSSVTRKTSTESAVSAHAARRLSAPKTDDAMPSTRRLRTNAIIPGAANRPSILVRVAPASGSRRTSGSQARRFSLTSRGSSALLAAAVDAESKAGADRPVHHWALSALLHVVGLAGISTTVAPFVVFARCPDAVHVLHLLALTSAVCTCAFQGFFLLLVYQLDVLVHLYTTFSFLFISVQLVLAHVAIADLCCWDARALALLSSVLWTLWALSIDAIPPIRATQLALNPKRWSRGILLGAIAAIVMLTWDALRYDSQRLHDRELFVLHVRGQRVSWFVFTFLMNRFFSLFTWLLRVLWRLGLMRDSDDLILIRGTVVYEDYMQLLTRQREDGERVGEVVAALLQQSGASGGRDARRLGRVARAKDASGTDVETKDSEAKASEHRAGGRVWMRPLVRVVRASLLLRAANAGSLRVERVENEQRKAMPDGQGGDDVSESSITRHDKSFNTKE
ncbi:hypothetical protein ATCC90586_000986 [Pythium insidiosum]|nr:hypothetical protein ATCC90586_000986 [Pythium insidiosum]